MSPAVETMLHAANFDGAERVAPSTMTADAAVMESEVDDVMMPATCSEPLINITHPLDSKQESDPELVTVSDPAKLVLGESNCAEEIMQLDDSVPELHVSATPRADMASKRTRESSIVPARIRGWYRVV
jgi:hypothetical protein